MFDKIRKWKEREIYTSPDTDKSIDWKYFKDTWKEYFKSKPKSDLEKYKNKISTGRFMIVHYLGIGLIYVLYFFSPEVNIVLKDIPNFTTLLHIIGASGIFYMALDYLDSMREAKKKIKELEPDA